MNLEQLIGRLKKTPSFMENVTHWETIPAKEASFAPFPAELDNRLPPVLAQRGVYKLYSHQREAFDLAATGKDICVVTPTASGKTMCYNLPVLNAKTTMRGRFTSFRQKRFRQTRFPNCMS